MGCALCTSAKSNGVLEREVFVVNLALYSSSWLGNQVTISRQILTASTSGGLEDNPAGEQVLVFVREVDVGALMAGRC
jgi:hypothetical protein